MSNTYTIKLAIPNPQNLTAQEIAASLQRVYDLGNIAGLFEVELVGSSIAVVTFERDIGEDMTATGTDLDAVTVSWAVDQLFCEFKESYQLADPAQGDPAQGDPAHHVHNALVHRDCTVAGLPCQHPRLRLFLEVAYENQLLMEQIAKSLTPERLEGLAMEYLGFCSKTHLLAARVESINVEGK